MTINATFTVENTAGVANSVVNQLLAVAQAAVDLWSAALAGDSTTNITISILDNVPSGRAQGGFETSKFLGTSGGNNVFESGVAYELRSGQELGQAGNDIHISIARDYLLNELFLDATPATADDIPVERTDGLSVLQHEIGHALGFIGYYNESNNTFFSNANTPYDTHLIQRDGETFFDGANVRAFYGDAVALTNNNYAHYGNTNAYPGTSTDPLTGLMNGVVYYRGYRYTIGDLDLAFLADMGVGTIRDDLFSIGLMKEFNGGAGVDSVDFTAATAGVTVSLATQTAQDSIGAGLVTLVAIENLTGSAFDDMLTGTTAANVLTGGVGDDRLDGAAGADRLIGGAGDDTYVVDNAGDVVVESARQGNDTVLSGITYTLLNAVENLTLTGRARIGTGNGVDNHLIGSGKGDTLSGLAGNDLIEGGAGKDRIDGGIGSDTIVGGRSRDVMTGGDGADSFVFVRGDSAKSARGADTITDFSHAQRDQIDLSAIDAITGRAIDPFTFIGAQAFSQTAGELRYEFSDGDTLISGDTNGDGRADLIIRLTGQINLVRGDFLFAPTAALPIAAETHDPMIAFVRADDMPGIVSDLML